jgi:hypothetical protein
MTRDPVLGRQMVRGALCLLFLGFVLGSCRRMPIPPDAGSNAERECQSVCREGQARCLGAGASSDAWNALISAGVGLFRSGDCSDGLAQCYARCPS